jgi:hypothetical protein
MWTTRKTTVRIHALAHDAHECDWRTDQEPEKASREAANIDGG